MNWHTHYTYMYPSSSPSIQSLMRREKEALARFRSSQPCLIQHAWGPSPIDVSKGACSLTRQAAVNGATHAGVTLPLSLIHMSGRLNLRQAAYDAVRRGDGCMVRAWVFLFPSACMTAGPYLCSRGRWRFYGALVRLRLRCDTFHPLFTYYS